MILRVTEICFEMSKGEQASDETVKDGNGETFREVSR